MCDQNSECDGDIVFEATGAKDVYLYCSENDTEYRIPVRQTVNVCGECGEPDWMTLG